MLRNLKIIFKYILYEKENFKEKKKCLLICNFKIKKLLNKKNVEFYHIIRLKIKLNIENYIILVKCCRNYRINIAKTIILN